MLNKSTLMSIILSASTLYSPSSLSACPPSICSEEVIDVASTTQKIEENKKNLAEAKDTATNSMLSDMFAYKEELPGKECLDGLQSINISSSFVDITTGYPNLLAALMDQIINAGCAAVVEKANEQTASANNSINSFGSQMSDASGGLMSLESETTTDGFGYDVEVKSIQDMPEVKDQTELWNKKVGESIYGESGYSAQGGNSPTDIDLTDDRYYKNNSPIEGSYEIYDYDVGEAAQKKIDNAACWLTEDC